MMKEGTVKYKCGKCDAGIIEKIVESTGPGFRLHILPCTECGEELHLFNLSELTIIESK